MRRWAASGYVNLVFCRLEYAGKHRSTRRKINVESYFYAPDGPIGTDIDLVIGYP